MTDKGRVLQRYRFRLNLALGIDRLAWSALVALFAAGLWILITHRFAPEWIPWTRELLIALGVAVAASACALTLRRAYTRDETAAFVDWHSGAGGLFLTLQDRSDDRWDPLLRARVSTTEPPPPRWTACGRRLLPGLLFLALALMIPVVLPEWKRRVAEAGQNTLNQLKDRLDSVQQQKLFAKEEEQALQNEMEQIQAELSQGRFGAKDWEAADAMRQRMDRKVAHSLEAAARGAQALAAAQREALDKPLEWSLDDDAKTEAQKELEKALMDMASENLFEDLPEGLDAASMPDLLELLRDFKGKFGKLSAADAEEYAKRLAALKDFLKKKGKKLKDLCGDGT